MLQNYYNQDLIDPIGRVDSGRNGQGRDRSQVPASQATGAKRTLRREPIMEQKPNILFIIADDLGWGDLSCHGSEIRTPNIDRMMTYGVELTQHYVCPLCTPTRASLMTGRYPGRFGIHATSPSNPPVLPDGYETLAMSLRNAGYDTGLFGKWHLGSAPQFNPSKYGFNYSYGSLAGGVDPYNHHYKEGEFSRTWHRNGELLDNEKGHVTDLITEEAVKWIESRTEPWFCYVPFTAVHVPINAPSKWLAQYEHGRYDEDPGRDQSFKRYAAYTSQMDATVGELIDAVKRCCQFENTIIFFGSDNGAIGSCLIDESDKYPGWHWDTPKLGSNLPFRGQKGQMYEGGVRTPAVITWPGTLEHGVCDEVINITDWMPTFTKLVGYKPELDPQFDGIDVGPAIFNGQSVGNRTVYWNLRERRFAYRQGRWKLIVEGEPMPENCELYNIDEDPHETSEVASDYPDIVWGFLAKITQERKKDNTSVRPDMVGKSDGLVR